MDIMDRFIAGLSMANPLAVTAMAINQMARDIVFNFDENPYQRDSFVWGDEPRHTRMKTGEAVY